MSDLLSEVDEMMRQERITKFWQENGKAIIAFVVLTILATAAISGYRTWDTHVRSSGTDRLMSFLEAPDFPENIQTAELDMRGGLRGIALMTAAGAFLEEGKAEEAIALYQRTMQDKSIPGDILQLSVLMHTRLQGGDNAHEKLEEIWSDKKSPWRYHAHLEAAALYAEAENYTKAREHLSTIQEGENLPDTLYSKTRALDQVYALKQHQKDKGK